MSQKKYTCDACKFFSTNKKDYTKHLRTVKHKRMQPVSMKAPIQKYECPKCHKCYVHHSSYYRHRKTCNQSIFDKEKESMKEIIKNQLDIITRQTKEAEMMRGLMNELITATREMVPKIGNNNVSINVFLNEHCKNAMNLTDFVDKIRITLDDLIKTRQFGYVNGISNIFIRNLRDLSDVERPIHCSDQKRLKFYIKDNNRWEKDGAAKMKKAIGKVAIKQVRAIKEWEESHPGYLEDEDLMDQWRQMIQTTMGGISENDRERDEKEICRNVGTNVILKDALDKV